MFDCSITESADAKRVEEKFRELNNLVDRFIENLYKEWASNVSEASKFNLNQHLITRNPKNHLIQLNFHPQVIPSPFFYHHLHRKFPLFSSKLFFVKFDTLKSKIVKIFHQLP